MRLIDAERLDVFAAKCPDGRDVYSFMDGVTAVLDEVDKLPVINLVQCKDCKDFHELHDGIGVCRRDNGRDYHDVCGIINGDWFCADGERKDDE